MMSRETSTFSIYEYFNSLPIRIIGTSIEPFFYAVDICAILGVVNPYRKVEKFDETEILTTARRQELNIETCRIDKNGKKYNDNRIILLTEHGAIRLIISSRSELARPLKHHIYNIIREFRLRELQKLIINPDKEVELPTDYLRDKQDDSYDHYIYLLIEREFIKTHEPIYKIGKTRRGPFERFKHYPNGSIVLLLLHTDHLDVLERNIINALTAQFTLRNDIGSEYFEGDKREIISTIFYEYKMLQYA